MSTTLLVQSLGALFAIMNPFVALPMFLSLTSGYDAARQKRTAVRVAMYSLALSLVILVGGQIILRFFGLAVDDFRIAGGIVLLTIALGMLNGSGNTAHAGTEHEQAQQKQAAEADSDIAFYPMSFPMMVGPGTITTIIVLGGGVDIVGHAVVAAALVVTVGALFVVLWFAPNIGRHLSATLQVIMTRLMGMVLAAIAVEMVIVGLTHVFPAWTR